MSLLAQHADIKAVFKAPADTMRNSSMNDGYGMVHLVCGQHSRCLQLRSVVRSKLRAQKGSAVGEGSSESESESEEGRVGEGPNIPCCFCKICVVPKSVRVSRPEARAYSIFSSRYPNLVLQEESVVPGFVVPGLRNSKRWDVVVQGLRLVVEVDGAGHFPGQGKGHHDSSEGGGVRKSRSECAGLRDECCNQAVMQGRGQHIKGLLRLHYKDTNDAWGMSVARALELARNERVQCFVFFSPRYARALMLPC